VSKNDVAEELRAAALEIRKAPSCPEPDPSCKCEEAERLADAFELEALRCEESGVVAAGLLESARRINHFGGVL